MAMERIYLDYNATAPLRPSVRARMIEMLGVTGNPSSVHAEGRAARAAVEEARADVARLVDVRPEAVTFTSGATEAAGLALTPDLRPADERDPTTRLIVSAVEHPAILQGNRFPAGASETVPVRADGGLDLAALEACLDRQPGRAVLALQAANGETGVVQPVAAAAALVHARGGLLVCDAVQAAGRLDCRAASLGADVIIVSAHKLGGPQGVGAMIAARSGLRFGAPMVRGGGQERGLRGGTENVGAIAGFGVAARMVADLADMPRVASLRDRLESGLRDAAPGVVIFGQGAPRLPNTTAFAVPGIASDTLLIALDLAGLAVSTGSACSSGKVSRSHVLEAMGVNTHLGTGMIRVSLGWASTAAHVDRFVEALAQTLQRLALRGMRSAA